VAQVDQRRDVSLPGFAVVFRAISPHPAEPSGFRFAQVPDGE
jgi:hypothetical protein